MRRYVRKQLASVGHVECLAFPLSNKVVLGEGQFAAKYAKDDYVILYETSVGKFALAFMTKDDFDMSFELPAKVSSSPNDLPARVISRVKADTVDPFRPKANKQETPVASKPYKIDVYDEVVP